MCLFVCMFVCLLVCVFVCLFVCICLIGDLFFFLFVCGSLGYLFGRVDWLFLFHLYICLVVCLFVFVISSFLCLLIIDVPINVNTLTQLLNKSNKRCQMCEELQ